MSWRGSGVDPLKDFSEAVREELWAFAPLQRVPPALPRPLRARTAALDRHDD
jgi:hypothetical protein